MSGMEQNRPNSFDDAIRKIMTVFEEYVKHNLAVGIYYNQQLRETKDADVDDDKPKAEDSDHNEADKEAKGTTDEEADFSLQAAFSSWVLFPITARLTDMEIKCAKVERAHEIVDAVLGDGGLLAAAYDDFDTKSEWISNQLDAINNLLTIKNDEETVDLLHKGIPSGTFDAQLAFVKRVITLMRQGESFAHNKRTFYGQAIEAFSSGLNCETQHYEASVVSKLDLSVKLIKFLLGTMVDIYIDQAKTEELGATPLVPEIARRAILASIFKAMTTIESQSSDLKPIDELLNLLGILLNDIAECKKVMWANRNVVSRGVTSVVETLGAPLSILPLYSSLPAMIEPSENAFMQRYRTGIEQIQSEAQKYKAESDKERLVNEFQKTLPNLICGV